MDSAPHASATESLTQVSYARRPTRHGPGLRFWVTGGAVVVLLLLGSAYGLRSTSLGSRVFGRGGPAPNVYVVKPVDLSITLTEDGELKPRNSVNIKCELEGQSTILTVVEESTQVKKGDLLVELASDAIKDRLDSEEIQLRQLESALEASQQSLLITRNENLSNIKKCEIDREVAELELERYQEGDYKRSLKAAEIAIAQTNMDIKRREEDLEKNRGLMKRGFVTPSKIEQLEFDLQKARWQLEQNELQKHILENYEKRKNETQKQAHLEQTIQELERERQRATSREKQALAKVEEQESLLTVRRRRVAKLREQYEKCKIYAPADGIVQYPTSDWMWRSSSNQIAPGERVYEGQTLIVLPDTSQMMVAARIHEADRHQVHEGLPCIVKVPAVPDQTFTGRIARVAQFADTANRWLNPELKEHTTEILLDETDAPLSPGDSAEVKILIGEVSNALAVPVQCVFARGSKNYVFLSDGGSTEYVEVKLGRSSTSMVEVTEGLEANHTVLMHVSPEFVATLPVASAVPVALQVPPQSSGSGTESAGPSRDPGKARQPQPQPGGKRPGPRRGPRAASPDGPQQDTVKPAAGQDQTRTAQHKPAAKPAATQPSGES